MVNILLIGSGAREHAIAEALKKSTQNPSLYALMAWKNPGIAELCEEYIIAKYDDLDALGKFAEKVNPEFCVIGPEAPLAAGAVDFLEEKGIPSVGPKKILAQLETSKSFTRNIMQKYSIAGLPKFHAFDSMDGIGEFIDMLSEEGKEFVIKPDGLTGGKGVMVQGDHLKGKDEALLYCKEILSKGKVVVEEKLDGEEFSLQCFTDGKAVIPMPAVQDHKRAFEDDKGPNTGGMGSYSMENHLLPFLNKEHIIQATDITKKVADALFTETGEYYKGIMYGGFILTKEGIKLIEYNARFGDPETMNVLPIMITDFVEVCRAIINQELDKMHILFESKATVCKYAVPDGYPSNPKKGEEISFAKPSSLNDKLKVYYASVEETGLVSSTQKLKLLGSRAVAFVSIASSIKEAEKKAEEAASKIKGPVFHRSDIGTEKLLSKRTEHMKKISGI